jgi:hypothetical protein
VIHPGALIHHGMMDILVGLLVQQAKQTIKMVWVKHVTTQLW